jgi:two-component system cell cycle response regulator
LPNTDATGGLIIAERLRTTIGGLVIHTDKGDVSVTISIGITGRQPADMTIERLIDRADQALYVQLSNRGAIVWWGCSTRAGSEGKFLLYGFERYVNAIGC